MVCQAGAGACLVRSHQKSRADDFLRSLLFCSPSAVLVNKIPGCGKKSIFQDQDDVVCGLRLVLRFHPVFHRFLWRRDQRLSRSADYPAGNFIRGALRLRH